MITVDEYIKSYTELQRFLEDCNNKPYFIDYTKNKIRRSSGVLLSESGYIFIDKKECYVDMDSYRKRLYRTKAEAKMALIIRTRQQLRETENNIKEYQQYIIDMKKTMIQQQQLLEGLTR